MMNWRKLNGDKITLPLAEYIEDIIIEERAQDNEVSISIGSDSQCYSSVMQMATAIVFRRKGKGAFMLVSKEVLENKYSIKERMLLEVARSIEVAYPLCDLFTSYDLPMEIHVDINSSPQYKSNVAMKEALGYIMGMGFDYKLKPDSFASTSAANLVVN